MTYCIIIRGPLGVGKTVVAKKLSKTLNAKYVSVDSLLAKNRLDKINKRENCIPAKNFIKASEIIIPKVKNILKGGKIVVFDGNFYHKSQISHLIKELKGWGFYTFTLKSPLSVCIKRNSKRKNSYEKSSAEAVYKLVSRFDYGTRINTKNKTPGEVVKEILTFLPK